MSTYKYDIPMPEDYKKLLIEIVEKSKQNRSLTCSWVKLASGSIRWIGEVGGVEEKFTENIQGDPFESFGVLGMMEIRENESRSKTFVLKPNAFEWANYQKKKRFGKWLERLPGNIRDIVIAVAFILSVALTIIQIVQLISNK